MGFLTKFKEKWDALVGSDADAPPPQRMTMPGPGAHPQQAGGSRAEPGDDRPTDPS